MAEQYVLSVELRDQGGRHGSESLRATGFIPGVLYGHGVDSSNVQIKSTVFAKLFSAAGESSLVDVVVGNAAPVKALIHEVQYDPLSHEVTHVDFYQVNMNEEIHAEVELVFEGVAPAVKELGGTLVKNMSHVEIKCLPANLLHDLKVDITALATFDDTVRVSDLSIPEGVDVLDDSESVIALVEAPRTEEELKALEEEVVEDVADVEVAGKDTEEPVEGETPAVESEKKES